MQKPEHAGGKFRPWLLVGTLCNAIVLYLMFAAPPAWNGSGIVAYAAITYVVWGVTYTMMDIPFWSMIPAFTEGGKEREKFNNYGAFLFGCRLGSRYNYYDEMCICWDREMSARVSAGLHL